MRQGGRRLACSFFVWSPFGAVSLLNDVTPVGFPSLYPFGRWGSEALDFLRDAAHAACERLPQLAHLGHRGPAGLLAAWHGRLSVALQRPNAACLLQAGRVRGVADLPGATGWEEDIEELLRNAAAFAAAGGVDA